MTGLAAHLPPARDPQQPDTEKESSLEIPRQAPFLRLTWEDPHSPARGFLVIDRLVGGIATGGTRMRPGCTLEEVTELAREMSLKAAAFDLPAGGAKGGIDYDPAAADAEDVRLRFLQAMRPMLEGTWVTAGDLGTPQELIDQAFTRAGIDTTSLHAALTRSHDPHAVRTRITAAFAEDVEGFRMPGLIGGFGVAHAALAAFHHAEAEQGNEPREPRAVVQGFGAMGGSSARYLSRAGVRVVGIADADGLIVNTESGLDVEALLRARTLSGVVDRSVLRPGDRELPRGEWLSLDADILVPAAVSPAITEQNCDDVRARLIVEAANVPVTPAAETRLLERGVLVVPDFVANAGAAAWAWWVILGYVADAQEAFDRLSAEMRLLVARMMADWAAGGGSPRLAALRVAADNAGRLTNAYGEVVPARSLYEPEPTHQPEAATV